MLGYIKKIIKNTFYLMGFEISKRHFKEVEIQISPEEAELYKMLYSEESIKNRKFYNMEPVVFFILIGQILIIIIIFMIKIGILLT